MRKQANRELAESKAREILCTLDLRKPDEIDLELVAAYYKAFVKEDDLDNYDAKMVRRDRAAIITVNIRISEVSRKRFSVAHEFGHFILHSKTRQLTLCDEQDMQTWKDYVRPEETEANAFAAELLMPEAMIASRLVGKTPDFRLISALAKKFNTSLTACAIQFVKYTQEPCMLVASYELKRIWWCSSKSFLPDFWIRNEENLHPFSIAYELCGNRERRTRAHDISAGAWLDRYDADGKECVTEDSITLGGYGLTLSLIWIHDVI